MDAQLMELLSRISDEEREILSGKSGVDRQLYTSSRNFTVDSGKVLRKHSLIDIRPHTRFIRFPRHRHNYVEVIYMCSGSTEHIINGSERVTLNTGELLFLNQSVYHEILPARQEDIAINFIILPAFFDMALDMVDRQSTIGSFLISTLRGDTCKGQYLHFRVADVLPVQNLVENMAWSIVNDHENATRINELTMALLLMQLANQTDRIDKNNPEQHEYWLIMSALKYIDGNYRQAGLKELSLRLNQSIYRLSRLIKSSTGFTFKQLLQQKRMSVAAGLLVKTDLTVSQIIEAVGYDNTSYFYRVFKENYALSPKEYRDQCSQQAVSR